MNWLLKDKVQTGLSIGFVSYSITKHGTKTAVFEYFGGDSFFTQTVAVGSGLTRYLGSANRSRTVFLGYCETLKTYILRFSGEGALKAFKEFVENFLFPCTSEEIFQDIRLTSVEALMVCMPSAAYSSSEDYILAIEKIRQAQQKSLPKVEIKQGTLFIGGKTGNNSIRISALKSNAGNIDSLCMSLKAKGPVAEKIGNLFRSNSQSRFEDVLAFHILTTLNSISSTALLELFKQDFVKFYAVGSILLQQNTEKQVFSPTGTYVARSLTGVANKLYSHAHSAEVQVLVVEWLQMLVVNQKFIDKGGNFINSLKGVFDGKNAVPTESDVPVAAKPLRKRTTRKAVEDKIADASQTNG